LSILAVLGLLQPLSKYRVPCSCCPEAAEASTAPHKDGRIDYMLDMLFLMYIRMRGYAKEAEVMSKAWDAFA